MGVTKRIDSHINIQAEIQVLANRLRLVIGSVISESQTAFVKDRQILDGILIANEAVDEARKTKKELLLFKVDFEKAYDSVDWSYLDAVMGRMSFPVLWRKWIKECICTASASVLVNGSPTEEFRLQRDGVDGLGGRWFGEGVVRKVGDGTESYFWTDPWLGWTPLCARFDRLFDLVVNKSSTVAEMCSLGWDTGGEAWVWQRHLWAWEEEMLGECQVLLHDFILQAQLSDTWIWRLDPVSGYSVRGVYQLLTSHPSDPLDDVLDLIWHKQVPLKVSIFAWRLLRDRLPTKTNLATRGIITSEAQACVAGCGGMETAQHLFIACSIFGSLWSSVRSWIGFSSVDPHNLTDHFLQFTFSSGGLSVRRSFLQLTWLVCVWVIWNERNQRLFRNSEQSLPQLLDKVKLYSYWWLKTTNINLVSNYHSWWTSHFTCLGMV
ncbi:hypothetical protein TSUD_53330 [Trifolium subterraneum]|uniref:Reverse transcriptase domain-containing protein n=1 Tax=Trifolium subterraneum TaxID=3900 RepID=A0A2Z6MCX2_TRISU|nr:hypothetical protein TSUD_53330 [Trifolium subterraneum]